MEISEFSVSPWRVLISFLVGDRRAITRTGERDYGTTLRKASDSFGDLVIGVFRSVPVPIVAQSSGHSEGCA